MAPSVEVPWPFLRRAPYGIWVNYSVAFWHTSDPISGPYLGAASALTTNTLLLRVFASGIRSTTFAEQGRPTAKLTSQLAEREASDDGMAPFGTFRGTHSPLPTDPLYTRVWMTERLPHSCFRHPYVVFSHTRDRIFAPF